MNLGSRLAKLEAKAAAVVRCAWCRYNLVSFTPALRAKFEQKGEGERPVVYDILTCPWCGHKYQQALGHVTEREAESLRLWYHKYDGETYTDERAYAAQLWWGFRWEKQATEEFDDDAPRPAANSDYRGNYGRGRQERPKESQAVRARRELKEEADSIVRKARAREKRLYGPRSFPLEETLKGLRGDCQRYAHLHDEEDGYRARSAAEVKARRLLAYARCMEACELALWGEVEEETARALETLPAEIERLAEVGRAEKREKEERERREREERERQRLERLGIARPAPTTPQAEASPSIEEIIAARYPSPARHSETPWSPSRYRPPEGDSGSAFHSGRQQVTIPEIPPPPIHEDPTAGLYLVSTAEAARLADARRFNPQPNEGRDERD
jgi:hypothetical protein